MLLLSSTGKHTSSSTELRRDAVSLLTVPPWRLSSLNVGRRRPVAWETVRCRRRSTSDGGRWLLIVPARSRRRGSAKASTEFGGDTEPEDLVEVRDLGRASSCTSLGRRKVSLLAIGLTEPRRPKKPLLSPPVSLGLLSSSTIALSKSLAIIPSRSKASFTERRSGRAGLGATMLVTVPRRDREGLVFSTRGIDSCWCRWSSRSDTGVLNLVG